MPAMEVPQQQQPMEASSTVAQQPAAQPEMTTEVGGLRGGIFEECGCCGCSEECGCC